MPAKIIFVCGDESGVGKTSVCLGLLSAALQNGYKPEELAYIKPCTQCEDVQLLWKWCESEGIQHEGVGPILFRQGYTQQVRVYIFPFYKMLELINTKFTSHVSAFFP